MCLTGKKRFAALFAGILAGTIALTSVYAATEKDSSNSGSVIGNTTNYISTNRDTRLPEEPIEIKEQSVADYEKLYETDSAIYYFRDDRDVIAVYDKESGYLWKTGLDSGIGKDLKKQARKAETEEEFDYFERNPIEENLNEVYTHFANSLVSIEYIKGYCDKHDDCRKCKLHDSKNERCGIIDKIPVDWKYKAESEEV